MKVRDLNRVIPMENYQETSREAWDDFAPVSGTLDDQIIHSLANCGPDRIGLACFEIEAKIGRVHQAVSGNLRHLVEDGKVEWAGTYTMKGSRRVMVWRLKPCS